MKKLIILTILIFSSFKIFACAHAEINRIFPVGIVPGGVAVIEMRLVRGEVDERTTRWAGTSALVIYNEQQQEKSRALVDTLRFLERDYDVEINKAFRAGLEKAKRVQGIELLKPVSILFADYSDKCSALRLKNDTNKRELSLVVNKKNYPVTVMNDANSIARVWMKRYFDDGMKDYWSYYMGLGISSVRKFKAGNRELLVVHLGSGQTMYSADNKPYPAGKEYKAKFQFDNIENSAFDEPMMHHGRGFDVFVFL